MADKKLEDMPPQDRRGFFTAGLARLLGPVAEYLEKKLPPQLLIVRRRPRPPGAIPEKEFLDTCYRCGSCADTCPVNAIVLIRDEPDDGAGSPYIEADRQACVMCDELSCMKVCPSGALKPVDRFEIRMGLAKVDYGLCLRSKGQPCTECVTRCPLGATAIKLDDRGHVRVIAPTGAAGRGCTGCGVCQQHCPTIGKRAIRVEPL
jgi:MauM/NapG family ferredoxin protein